VTIRDITLRLVWLKRPLNWVFSGAKERIRDVYAIIPLKRPVSGMKVRIDGRTFINYAQFESGVVAPHYVASQVDLPHRAYIAKDSMICNFA
jgi:hypothetical protein